MPTHSEARAPGRPEARSAAARSAACVPRKICDGVRRRWFERRLERTPLRRFDGLVMLGNTFGGWIVQGG